jgi:hypothetical protein
MSPKVEAAIIAAGVGILTLIGAVYGTRKTSQDTKDALHQQLTEQGKQLKQTLKAQGKQLKQTLAEQHFRTLNERFATAAEKLGADKPPAVRLAGVYAMAGLADDWEDNRQACIDVLWSYRPVGSRLAASEQRRQRGDAVEDVSMRLGLELGSRE